MKIKKTIGVTVGKFMPPHLGHQLMIDFGASMLEQLIVLVDGSNSDEIPVDLRIKWLQEHYKHNDRVSILQVTEKVPVTNLEVDAYGTILDVEFWKSWTQIFQKYAPYATHFVSSDMYGKKAAQLLNVKWLPVDIERETFNVSGTKIRSNYSENIHMMIPEAQSHFRKTVAIIGPESTGKSTLVKLMAKIFNSTGLHEYGRTITISNENQFTNDDFFLITKGQDTLIKLAKKNGTGPFVLTDTEAYVTYLYGLLYQKRNFKAIREFAAEQRIDHYIVMAPTVPWVDDGLRVQPNQEERMKFYDDLISMLIADGKSFSRVTADTYQLRSNQVEDILETFYESKTKFTN